MKWLKLGYMVFRVQSILTCHVSKVQFCVLLDSGARSVPQHPETSAAG